VTVPVRILDTWWVGNVLMAECEIDDALLGDLLGPLQISVDDISVYVRENDF
jgi:hypothetical protein